MESPVSTGPRRPSPVLWITLAIAAVLLMSACPLTLIPMGLMHARAQAREAQCKNNLHNLGIAGHRFAAMKGDAGSKITDRGWGSDLIPYVQDTSVFLCPEDNSFSAVEFGPDVSYGLNNQVKSFGVLVANQVLLAEYGKATIDLDGVEPDDGPESIELRHNGDVVNVLFGNGSVKSQRAEELFQPQARHWQGRGR